jgi:hypothetical protein
MAASDEKWRALRTGEFVPLLTSNKYWEYELFSVIICLRIGVVMTMTVTEHKKYIDQMDAYIRKIKEESREEALDFFY